MGGTALSQELITTIEKGHRGLCSPSIQADKSSYVSGESIKPIVTICSSNVEWIGVYVKGTYPGSANAVNWQYTCGGQTCATSQSVGTFQFEMFGPTAGSMGFPLPNGSYQVFYMSAAGVISGGSFTYGYSVASPVVSKGPTFRALYEEEN